MNRPSWKSPLALTLFIGATVLGLALDQYTKWLSFTRESTRLFDALIRDEYSGRWLLLGADQREVRLLDGLLHFRATVNEGAIFGLGQGQRTAFIVVSVAAIAFLSYLFTRTGRSRLDQLLLGALLAGVLGNMYDRITAGYVRDMIFALPDVRWPGTWQLLGYPHGADRLVFPWIFNVADCLLVCGVSILMLRNLFHHHHAEQPTPSDATRRESNPQSPPP